MNKSLILIILIFNLIFVSCDGEKEALVEDNMFAMQTTVEAMAMHHFGRYPSSINDQNYIAHELPDNFVNPYNGNTGSNAVDWGLAINEGNVGYEADGTTFAATSYTITGAGKDGRLLDLILTP